MRELNTIELNEVNGAVNIPAVVSSHPNLTAATVLGVIGLGVAAYFGYKRFCANSTSTLEVATQATDTAAATVSATSISG